MNEMIRQHENSCKLLEINVWMGKFYHGNLVEPGRHFIKAGSVLKVNLIIIISILLPICICIAHYEQYVIA